MVVLFAISPFISGLNATVMVVTSSAVSPLTTSIRSGDHFKGTKPQTQLHSLVAGFLDSTLT